jgi:radical SAM protein with 4Fe4S-binding SPASM domain
MGTEGHDGARYGRRHVSTSSRFRPVYVVWELTLKCDLACRHCGSRAGVAREQEITVEEARGIAAQLADLGTREIAFIGGEAYLHPRWLEIVEVVAALGIRPTMTSGARALDAEACVRAAEAGLQAISVSIDGLESTHDTLRAVPGSWRACMAALGHIQAAGMQAYANTQFNRLNLPEVEELGQTLLDAGIQAWQVQLTGPMGRAADRPEWLLQPYELLELFPALGRVALAAQARGVVVNAGNNLGYFGPYEKLIRLEHFQGCAAGRHVLGIESSGDVKGCPSLPSAPYVRGNLRTDSLAEIWSRLDFARERDARELWGFCAGCYYAAECKGGCSWTSHTALGRRGNMPWCHHRALELDKRGLRERVELVEQAPGQPFDFGRFRLVLEPRSG